MPAKPALRTELLFYLSFLAAAALLVGVATLLVAASFAPERTFALVMLMIALEVGVFIVFGRYLVNRLVLWPLERVVATADAVAQYQDRKSTRLNSSHLGISYAVFC